MLAYYIERDHERLLPKPCIVTSPDNLMPFSLCTWNSVVNGRYV